MRPPASMPREADIVIIGGGIVGVSTALFLAEQGIDVAVCEKGHIAGEQSSRNWGWVRQQLRDTREMPMIVESLRIWRTLARDIGEDVGFHEQGIMIAARTDKEAQQYINWIKTSDEYGVETRFIEGAELAAQVRGSTVRWKGALYTPSDGRAEPHKAAPAIARAAGRKGASILTACAVRGLETEGGRVSAVVTEHGRIKTSTVLCAAGAWTSMFCRSLDVTVPQLKVRGTVARTAPAENVLDGNLYDSAIALRRRDDGGYTLAHGTILDHPITPSTFRFGFKYLPALMMEINNLRISIGREFVEEWNMPRTWALDAESPFEKTRVLNPAPSKSVLKGIRNNLDKVFPQLASVEIVESWAGMVETTPDVIPVIDRIDSIPGFYIATGFSGHGFGIGPGAGKAIAGMLTGTDSGIPLDEFRLSRFFDGTRLELQSSV
ncbi:MAG: FAD-dependent oxidoreductase [Woeseiaceae bacterium]|nr:FAD-dependent oxidoreductase [Woeseiaceae bacterium]NIP21677.1 FAD-dependent oxidoreductase [Woeseiaceae bacterium]NIS90763.1 FAD-dependent oxidoreductase [Woeseiaceae bacterium]